MASVAKSRNLRKAFLDHLSREVLVINGNHKTTNADSTNPVSRRIAFALAKKLGANSRCLPSEIARNRFEQACAEFLRNALKGLSRSNPGKWTVAQTSGKDLEIAEFEQYPRLREFGRLLRGNRQLRLVIGEGYFVKPDIVVFHHLEGNAEIKHRFGLADEGCLRDISDLPLDLAL